MNKTVNLKMFNRFFLFIFLNLILTGILFFSFQDGNDELGICDEYKKIEIVIDKNTKEFYYPFNNCDDIYYFKAVEDFNLLFSNEANVYQNRPTYIFSINLYSNKFIFCKFEGDITKIIEAIRINAD